MPSNKKKTVTLKENASSILKESQSQTDASEWVEYETDMKELYENLKEEGIDVPLDEKGVPILTPQFIKSLPPSVQPHAGGKQYAGGKPFKSTIDEPAPKRFLGRVIQTRTSIWEDYKKELNELYSILEKNGVSVPRDEDGVPIYNEEMVKSLPPEQVPHPAGVEFAPIPGMPPLADGTRVSPRLTLRLLTPALTKELLKRCMRKGIKVPMEDGKPNITSDFLRSIPPELLQDVLKPLYENQQRLSEKRESVISKLSQEKKNSLKTMLENKGIEVKSTEKGEPIIPMITIMQFTEEEVSQVLGEEDSHDIFKPAPQKVESTPDDTLFHLSKERRESIGGVLHEQGLSVDVDEDNVPIITKTNLGFLPKDALDELQIADEDISKPSESDIRKSIEEDDKNKGRQSKEGHEHHQHDHSSTKKSRKHISFRTGRGLFNLTRNAVKEQLAKRLESSGIEIKMTAEGELELTDVPNEIVDEFTNTIQEELRQIDAQEMHLRIYAMMDDEKELIHQQLEVAGIDLPTDETGNKVITVEFLEKLPRDVLINLLAKLFASPRESVEGEGEGMNEDEEDHRSASGKAETTSEHDEDIELDLTDDQREDFYDRLLEEGIRAPLDEVTGRPRFTREFVRTIPKKIAREIITAAAVNADDQTRRMSSPSEDSDEEEEEQIQDLMRKDENFVEEEETIVLGLRQSPDGLSYIADDKGHKVKYEKMVECLKKAYSDTELKKHEELLREKEAGLRAAIREERRHEEKDPELKRASSDVELQQMAMRFIPEYNPRPQKTDPINLFEHIRKPQVDTRFGTQSMQGTHKGVEFVHILEPSFIMRKADSLATVPSTVARKFSNDSVRGSALSTRLSDMPSMFSQGLGEDPSAAYLITASTQEFDISPESIADYREKWLSSFMSGFTPKQTFTICIINMITRKRVELRVCRENTLNEVCHLYMQYEDHPEYYVWKDIYGRLLVPDKSLVENGLMRQDEVLEFQGYRRLPIILLYFRDGFENDPPLPLNPLHALKQREPGLCRNY